MRPWLIVAAVLALLVWGAHRWYQDPRVRDLFRESRPSQISGFGMPAAKSPASREILVAPGGPAKAKARPHAPVASRPAAAVKPKDASDAAEAPAEPPTAMNTVDNQVVSRVVLQILAAKNLAYGVSLSTSDEVIVVEGIVDSVEKRKQILAIIEKARETRRIDADRLIVVQKRQAPAYRL
jgi:hypothetical protein